MYKTSQATLYHRNMKYKFKGTQIVNIPYVGTFEPGKVYEVEKEINHPDFEQIQEPKAPINSKSKK